MPRTEYSPCVLVDTSNLPEAEWLEWRRKGIGGSDAAAILGISPFATAKDLYYDKLKILPFGEIWDEYCRRCGKPVDGEWFTEIETYEKEVLEARA